MLFLPDDPQAVAYALLRQVTIDVLPDLQAIHNAVRPCLLPDPLYGWRVTC